MIFITVKRSDDFMTGKRNTSRPSRAKNDSKSAIVDHAKTTGHNIKWDHFDILASGRSDYHCEIKETLFIQELKPAFKCQRQQ